MDERRIAISFGPDFRNVDMARAAISGVCRETFRGQVYEPLVIEFALAFTEAMNNAVEHSGSRSIEVELAVDSDEVVFRLITAGGKFDPTAGAEMPSLDDAEELPEGGFGLAIIQELVDGLAYEYADGRNILTMKKMFHIKE